MAVLYATGVFAVFDLDQQGELRTTPLTGGVAAARIGRVTDLEWLTLPAPIGACVAAAAAGCMAAGARRAGHWQGAVPSAAER